jgi:hypothetical protein
MKIVTSYTTCFSAKEFFISPTLSVYSEKLTVPIEFSYVNHNKQNLSANSIN